MTARTYQLDLQGWLLLILLSLLWGGSFLFVGIAVKDVSPLVVVMARVVLAAAVLYPVHLMLAGPLPRDRQSWFALLVMSTFNNVLPFILIAEGQTTIASGLASVINATTPLFGAVFLAVAGEERLFPRKIIGLLIGLAGVVVLKSGNGLSLGGQSLGIIMVLGAAACYGFSGLWAKRRLRGMAPLTLATGQLICSSVTMAVLAFAFDRPQALLDASVQSWLALLGLALLATALAYIVFFQIIARSGAANVLLVTMLIPVSAIAMGYVVLAERLEATEVAGAAIIILSLAIIDGRLLSWLRPRDPSA